MTFLKFSFPRRVISMGVEWLIELVMCFFVSHDRFKAKIYYKVEATRFRLVHFYHIIGFGWNFWLYIHWEFFSCDVKHKMLLKLLKLQDLPGKAQMEEGDVWKPIVFNILIIKIIVIYSKWRQRKQYLWKVHSSISRVVACKDNSPQMTESHSHNAVQCGS